MLIRIVRMTFQEEKVESFIEMFNRTKKAIRNFEGCQHLELMRDYDNPSVFITYSHWESQDALNNYRHSELFKEVWAETKAKFDAKPVAFSMKRYMKVD